MTSKVKTALEKAVEAEQANQEKLTLRWLIIRKTMNRQDHIEAVEAMGPQEDWTELDQMIAAARKVSGKPWDELFNLSQGDIEKVILS